MDQPQPDIVITVPKNLAGGVLADFASISHSQDYFTLDFAAVTSPPLPVPEDPARPAVMNAQIVARVKILPAQTIEIMKALNIQLDAWEQETQPRSTHQ